MQRFLLPKHGCKRQRSLCTCQRLCTVLLHSCYPWRTAQKDIYLFLLDPSSPLQKGTCWKAAALGLLCLLGGSLPKNAPPQRKYSTPSRGFLFFPCHCVHPFSPRTQREDHHETLRGVPQFGALFNLLVRRMVSFQGCVSSPKYCCLVLVFFAFF